MENSGGSLMKESLNKMKDSFKKIAYINKK